MTAMTQMAMLPLRPQVAQYINKCGLSPIFIFRVILLIHLFYS